MKINVGPFPSWPLQLQLCPSLFIRRSNVGVRSQHALLLTTHCHAFCSVTAASEIRVRWHTIPSYGERALYSSTKDRHVHLNRYGVPGPMHHDLVNLRVEAEHSTHALPRGLDKETVASWIGAILRGAKEGDVRAIRVVHGAMQEVMGDDVLYPPLYEALMFGAGKLGDIERMLSLWRNLWRQHVNRMESAPPMISANAMSVVLECLATHRRWFEAERLFADFLSLDDVEPDANCFSTVLKHCTWTRDWKRSESYFKLMVGEYGLRPTSLCFRYLLQSAAHCHPPKWEEALSILRRMEKDWNITPNAAHFATVIHAVATRWAMVESPMSQDVMAQMDSGHHFEIYKKRLVHGALFDDKNGLNAVSDSDLQRVLDLFHEMTDEVGIVPNDRVFAELFYACDKARNLEMALRIRSFWKRRFPMIRQQALSLHKLIAICSTLSSWNDALSIYKSSVTVLAANGDGHGDGDGDGHSDHDLYGDDALYSFDGDTLALCAAHKVQPEIVVFNQMLNCSKKDVSRQILNEKVSEKEAEEVILERVHFVQSEMVKFQFTPNDMTWALLLQSAATVGSKRLCDRVMRRYFEFQRKQNRKWIDLNQEKEDIDCWSIYDCDSMEIRPVVRTSMIAALYWTKQMDRALQIYHDCYAVKRRFTHWFSPHKTPEKLMLDFHGFDPAVAVVAITYILENEFESVYAHLLCNDALPINQRDDDRKKEDEEEKIMVISADGDGDDDDDDRDNAVDRHYQSDTEKLEMTVSLSNIDRNNLSKKGRNLLIVTGRGKGNETGTSVLRPWIKLWLQNELNPPIRSHIHPRNVGMLVVDSQDILQHIRRNKGKAK